MVKHFPKTLIAGSFGHYAIVNLVKNGMHFREKPL